MSRWSQAFIPTLKEVPAEAQIVSHVYLLRGGFMRKLAAGIYTFLPLGWRVVKNVADIVRQEMDRAGALELLMPAAIPAELWQESGRWQAYGPELLRWKDRKQADFVTGPTHEEVVVDTVRRDVKSYRQLPLNLYHIQTKFRDEARPRAGLMRGREFIMKDAYSFDVDDEAAKRSYRAMFDAYTRIFQRCGLEFRPVEADTGNIGGTMSHEFQVLAQSGEDKIVSCTRCDYAANVEKAEVRRSPERPPRVDRPLEKVRTPGKKTIEEVARFLQITPARLVKTLVYLADGHPVVALVRGDHDVNELKLRKLVGAQEVVLAGDHAILEITGAPVGFAGPRGLKVRTVADLEVEGMSDAATGANEDDHHLVGFDMVRDAPGVEYADLRVAVAGDSCPRCGVGVLERFAGIEVGHVFFLGTKYSVPMGCTFLGDDGQLRPMVMGCYGIGITRTAAAAIEQNHDADGIIWPMALAPYQVELLTLQAKDAEVVAAADRLYQELVAAGIEVLYDDRDERPGAKFKDADLIGIPLRVAVGKKSLAEGKVELKPRRAKQAELIPAGDAAAIVAARVREALRAG
jgi:prolyl-tRNA synthetase